MEGKANRGDDEDKGGKEEKEDEVDEEDKEDKRTLREVVCRIVNHHALHIISWVKFK